MATPTKTKPAPVLENFYSVSQAAIRLGLRDEGDPSKKGEKWLRDGVNLLDWPCHRLAGQLKFSDSDLAVIAEKHRNATHHRSTPRRTRKRVAARPVK
jgi:hypothetical protein